MPYIAQNIDSEKVLDYLKDLEKETFSKENLEIEKIRKYYEGYRDGLEIAKNIFYCSNYEKK